ncbi:sensor histidine kinase [Subtercola boreus]|uniref:sensor histidine kinase n=1 Tax=Subtercola boreus TaxID=120213 RepID=UPI0011C07BDF|nr:HAMP domain-containing sensor histidine kinase [Subtercola boreus]
MRPGFRLRLTFVFFAVFVVAAAALLIIEYGVVSALFDRSLANGFVITPAEMIDPSAVSDPSATSWIVQSGDGSSRNSDLVATFSIVADAQAATRDEVLNGLVLWSALSLAVFSGLGSAVAWWLAGRPLRRIRDVTALAQNISEHDLTDRLALAGPRDEIRVLGDTFDDMLARLQVAFESQGVFIANASHELRTPIAVIRTSLEVALRRPSVSPEVRTGIERALRANQRSESLISSLLTLAGVQNADRPSKSSQRILPLVCSEIEAYAGQALLRDIVVLNACPASITAVIDTSLFELLFTNLLSNAIRYNHYAGSITIECEERPNAAILVITNTGDILGEPVSDLLKPFHRGASTRLANQIGGSVSVTPGSGLGLAIATSAADSLGGTLRLQPREGGGMRAEVVLPRFE